jgi:hypothetical protein
VVISLGHSVVLSKSSKRPIYICFVTSDWIFTFPVPCGRKFYIAPAILTSINSWNPRIVCIGRAEGRNATIREAC